MVSARKLNGVQYRYTHLFSQGVFWLSEVGVFIEEYLNGDVNVSVRLIMGDIHQSKLKLDPYEQCPCLSGRKFKFCCYEKSRRKKQVESIEYSPSRIEYKIHQDWKNANIKMCLSDKIEECSGPIKRAHSIQNNKFLKRISDDGHLYHITNDLSAKDFKSKFKRISRNDASTFYGFCDYHDNVIFEAIEKKEIVPDKLQCFLFAYRAMAIDAHKYFRKLQMHANQFIENPIVNEKFMYFYRKSLLDLEDVKKDLIIFNGALSRNDYDSLVTFYRKLDFQVAFATTSSFAVERDVNNNLLNDIYSSVSEDMPSIYLTVVPDKGSTHIFISYIKKQGSVYTSYFDQLEGLEETKLQQYLNFLIINYTENIFFSKDYIENLTDQECDSLLNSFSSSIILSTKLELILEGKYFKFNLFKNLYS